MQGSHTSCAWRDLRHPTSSYTIVKRTNITCFLPKAIRYTWGGVDCIIAIPIHQPCPQQWSLPQKHCCPALTLILHRKSSSPFPHPLPTQPGAGQAAESSLLDPYSLTFSSGRPSTDLPIYIPSITILAFPYFSPQRPIKYSWEDVHRQGLSCLLHTYVIGILWNSVWYYLST